jgi:hypothetical protein
VKAVTNNPKDGAQRKREAGMKEFREWVTPDEADFLREVLRSLRVDFSEKEISTAEARAQVMFEMLNET